MTAVKLNQPRIAAIVPMRHDSERVVGKNYRSFAGKPLYHYIIETLLACKRIDTIVIDTDSPAIMTEAATAFPSVKILERPVHLRAGHIPMNEVLLHTVSQVPADVYLQTHSTNPLLTATSIEQAIDQFTAAYPTHDSLFSVTRMQSRLWDGLGRAVNHNPAILLRTQDLPPIYEENSCLYLFTRATLTIRHNRVGERPLLFELNRFEACDIDEEIDFCLAEQLYLITRNGIEHDRR